MAEAVIDLFELVQVEHEQGLVALRVKKALTSFGIKCPPVWQTGQVVGNGGRTAQVRHPRELAKRPLGAGRSRDQRHPRRTTARVDRGTQVPETSTPSPAAVATAETASAVAPVVELLSGRIDTSC